MACCDTSLRHPIYSQWFYILKTGIPWVILRLDGRLSFTHNIVPPHYSQKSRIPGGPHNYTMSGFVTGLKYVEFFQWQYIKLPRTGTLLFKSNQHCFAMSNDAISCQFIDLTFFTLHDNVFGICWGKNHKCMIHFHAWMNLQIWWWSCMWCMLPRYCKMLWYHRSWHSFT